MKFLAFLIASSFVVANAATQKSVPECSGEMANPSFTCHRPIMDDDLDIRFYMTEFQTCKNGKITELDHAYIGLYTANPDASGGDKLETIPDAQINVKLSDARTYFPDRADDITILLPTLIKMKSSQYSFEISVTNQTEPDFEGAMPDQNHYIASMKKFDSKGHLVGSAPMDCFVGF